MENSKIVVGLDIGTTKICCIVGRKADHGKIEILGMGRADSLGVKRGMVFNIDQTVQAISQAVEEAQNKASVEIGEVNVGIAGQHIKSMQHHGIYTRKISSEDTITQVDIDALIDDMYKLAMLPGEQIIHVLPQEYIVDGEMGIKQPIGTPGVRLEANFHIITGQTTAASNIKKCIEKAGLTMKDIILEPLASSEAVLSQEEKDAGVALVDIGGGTTDLAIFCDGIIRHTAVIPLGGNIITEDIKEGCNIIGKQAELLKVKFGSALASESQENEIVSIPGLRGRDPKEISVKNLASIIQARMEEIIEYVYHEIKNSGYEKKLIGGIVLTGGGSQMKHITQLTEFITALNTRIGYPNEHLAPGSPEDITSPMYATGVGLLMMGIQSEEKVKTPATSTSNTKKKEEVTGHSDAKKKGSWFSSLLNKTTEFFEDDAIK